MHTYMMYGISTEYVRAILRISIICTLAAVHGMQ